MTSQTEKQTIANTIIIVPDISRSKVNQKMKCSQLIEYNKRNIVLEKAYTKLMEKLALHPLLKNQN